MIKSFSCTNFRNVNISDLKFSRINILNGPNNSGKTNYIKALSFCADMMNCSGSLISDSAFRTAAICTHYFSKNYMALKTFQF